MVDWITQCYYKYSCNPRVIKQAVYCHSSTGNESSRYIPSEEPPHPLVALQEPSLTTGCAARATVTIGYATRATVTIGCAATATATTGCATRATVPTGCAPRATTPTWLRYKSHRTHWLRCKSHRTHLSRTKGTRWRWQLQVFATAGNRWPTIPTTFSQSTHWIISAHTSWGKASKFIGRF
jgi:hypothetical protein